ncbi:MAG: hypothetical protein ABR595_08970, partial [Psychroflexus sp.]
TVEEKKNFLLRLSDLATIYSKIPQEKELIELKFSDSEKRFFHLLENLEITKFLQTTYHILKRNGKYKLKETHWFEMRTDFEGELAPQINEGIKKAKWKNFEKSQKALNKSYANIKLLFPKEYLVKHPKDRV